VVIAWLAQCDPPIIPIIGGSTTDQIRQNIEAVSLQLSPDHIARLTAAGKPKSDID
jgi:aryl-alcohol dehydrogenase-like predicted oxidoreductase